MMSFENLQKCKKRVNKYSLFDCVGDVRKGRLCHPGSAGPGSRDQPNLELLREKLIMQDI